MDNKDKRDISFTDVINCFSEDTIRAKEILKDLHQVHSQGSPPGLKVPFADTSQIPDEDKSLVQKYLENQTRQELNLNNPTAPTSPISATTSNAPPLSFPWVLDRVEIAREIRRLNHPDEQKTDANAYELMMAVLNRIPLRNYCGQFYYLDGCIYRPISDQDLRSMIFPIVEHTLAAGKNSRMIGNVVDLLRDSPYIKVSHTTETSDRVFFLNGAYNLLRHELQPMQINDFITSYIPVEYITSNRNCPVFDDFLSCISGGDPAVITLCWEVIGYLLSNSMAAKSFFLMQGVGDSGKSVLGNLISSLFNQEAVSYLDIYRFKDKFATSLLRGKRLNISMDLPRVQLKREAIGVIKMLTGDDVITVEEKFHNPEAYKPTAKLLFGSNFPLMVADNDPAFQARLVTIPFRFQIPKDRQDKHLLEKLMAERSAIAVRALDYYLRLKANNYCFTKVDTDVTSVVGFVPDNEVLQAFLKECCVLAPGEFTFTEDLWSAYNRFRIVHNIPPTSDSNTFSRQLNRYCAGRILGKKRRKGQQSLNGYEGIGLRLNPENGLFANITEGGISSD